MHSPDIPHPDTIPMPSPDEALSHNRHLNLASALGVRALHKANAPILLDNNEREIALGHLQDHLVDISADPSGSDPAPYVSTDTLAALVEFERKPTEEKWDDATPIVHDDLTFRWFQKRNRNTPVLDDRGRPIFGRRVGYLSVGQFESPVLYCSDRKLRMVIKTTGGKHKLRLNEEGGNYHHTGGKRPVYSGYCRLPDPEIALPVRDRGASTLVQYKHQQSKTLREDLGLK